MTSPAGGIGLDTQGIGVPTGGIGDAPPVLAPRLDQHYARRAARLAQLADGHPMADYLRMAAALVQAQQATLDSLPLAEDASAANADVTPLTPGALLQAPYWRAALPAILAAFSRLGAAQLDASLPLRQTLAALRDASSDALAHDAAALLAGDFEQVDSARALFLWAALSLHAVQFAARLPASAWRAQGDSRQFCPACGGAPVASVVLGGAQAGLRYLHCGLCETRWHMVRSKCSNCEQGGKLNYWSLDSETAPITAESCGDCHSYLKVLYMDRDRNQDPIADDLATLALDAEVEREGYARSSVNPLLLPGRQPDPR
ncbi:formate dehydrogenase formation protein FdhE [plant metagenome]|uniref:Formate dehydrogenase formation protein FdhE n=1 Tax=plant metagenome TaxID=1297885 RepID=A0A484R4H7_9ZZZZ